MMKTNLSPKIAAKKECGFGPWHGRPHRLGHRLHRGRAGGEDGLPPGTLILGDRVFAYLLEYYPIIAPIPPVAVGCFTCAVAACARDVPLPLARGSHAAGAVGSGGGTSLKKRERGVKLEWTPYSHSSFISKNSTLSLAAA